MTGGGGDSPRVTVLMPVHNGEPYLAAALASILGQTFADFEFLVVDDGSTDGSRDVVRACRDPRIRLVENFSNMGVANSLNRGLALARGEYVARMDSDDESMPDRFEKQLRFLGAHPGVGVLGAGGVLVDGMGKTLTEFHYPEEHEVIRWSLHFFNPFSHPSVMMRRAVVLEAKGYLSGNPAPPGCRVPEDYELWWRLGDVTRLANLPDRLIRLRKHGGNIMSRYTGEYLAEAARINRERLALRLAEPVPHEMAEMLLTRKYDPPERAGAAARLIVTLFEIFGKTESLTAAARERIRRDVCERLAAILIRGRNAFRVPGVFALLAKTDPFFRRCAPYLARRVEAKITGRPLPS